MRHVANNTSEAVIVKQCVTEALNILKSPEGRSAFTKEGELFEKYRNNYILSELNSYKVVNKYCYLEIAYKIYKYMGYGQGLLDKYMKYQNLSDGDFETVYRGYISQTMSYSDNQDFVLKILNKVLIRSLYQFFMEIVKEHGGIDLESINQGLVIKMLTKFEDEAYITTVHEMMCEIPEKKGALAPSEKKNETDKVPEKEIEKNLGDKEIHWKGVAIEVCGVKLESKHQLMKMKNDKLQKIFDEISKDASKFKYHKFLLSEAAKATKGGSDNQIPTIMYRHIMLWLIKAMVFQTKDSGMIIKNYDFYWKNSEKLQPFLDATDNEFGKGMATGKITPIETTEVPEIKIDADAEHSAMKITGDTEGIKVTPTGGDDKEITDNGSESIEGDPNSGIVPADSRVSTAPSF